MSTVTTPEATLLVVDDEPSIRELLSASLRFAGFDVRTAADARRIAARFPTLAGIMIGRGLCARPGLAAEIRGAPPASRAAVAAFARDLSAEYARTLCGPAPLLGRLKELWSYLHASFEDGDALLRPLLRARTVPELDDAVAALTGLPLSTGTSGTHVPLPNGGVR